MKFKNLTPVRLFTDGSFDPILNITKWAYIIFPQNNDEIIYQENGVITDPELIAGRQIAGECQSVIEGLKYCKQNKLIADITYDYIGVENWVLDLFDKSLKPWKANKVYTKQYRINMFMFKNNINSFVKVKGHSGNFGNEMVDKLAKKAGRG